MKFAGFADEAGLDIETQIQATKQLGWSGIEMRMVGSKLHFDDVSDREFDQIRENLQKEKIQIISYASQIANWGRPISSDFNRDKEELLRIIPRMQKTKTKLVRIMSYPNGRLNESEWKKKVIERMKELCKMAEDGGVILAHENCDGWAGHNAKNTLELLSEVHSPALKLIYDTGNFAAHDYDPLEYYLAVKDHCVHIHIKDGKKKSDHKPEWTYPGKGQGRISEVFRDLKQRKYDGWLSIEPHLAMVVHESTKTHATNETPVEKFLRYGKMAMELWENAEL